MGLKDIGSSLPPGFRFYPSDEELVCHYLFKKIANEDVLKGTLVEIDLHTCEPWQLPEVAKLNSSEWYFFSFRDRKYATGFRTNRATVSGYWKATGKDRVILDPKTRQVVGMRKTLVFYRNRAPNGIKTGWIMHEFRLESPHMPPKEDWVLCRVFHKSKASETNNNYLHDHHNAVHIFEANHNAGSSSPTIAAVSPPTITMPAAYGNPQQQPHNTILPNSLIPPASTTTGTQPNQNCININQSAALDLALLTTAAPNLFQFLREGNPNNYSFSEMIMGSKNDNYDDHDYGLLWDMNLDENNHVTGCLRDHGDVNQQDGLEDVRFDDDDNGMVFNI